MLVFVVLSVHLSLRGIQSRGTRSYIYFLLARLAVFLGVLSKGPVALFPLSAVALYWLLFRQTGFWKMLLANVVFLFGLIFPALFIYYTNADSRQLFELFYERQVGASLSGLHTTVEHRSFIIIRLLSELIPMMIVVLGIVIAGWLLRKKNAVVTTPSMHLALLFLLIALAGSLPIAISHHQSGYYLVPSFAFYALAGAHLIAPWVGRWVTRWNHRSTSSRIFRGIAVLSTIAVIIVAVFLYKIPNRNVDEWEDINIICQLVPPHAKVAIPTSLSQHYGLRGHLMRNGYINLAIADTTCPYFLTEKAAQEIPVGYYKMDQPLKVYQLLKRAD